MQRVVEPELMEDDAQAEAYASADFSGPNAQFCNELHTRVGDVLVGRAADLGCGPAAIAIHLAQRHPGLSIDALDGSAAMLRRAERACAVSSMRSRIRLWHASLDGAALPAKSYDFVLSNSLLHHLHDPLVLWREVQRIAQTGAAVQVMDLARPISQDAARAIVDTYAAGEPEVLRNDFFASLCAAFRPAEVRAQLRDAGLGDLHVSMVSDRHLLVFGRTPAD
jgi:ubiquinone/menaquinone biosynthesis C-methylase UbiE